MSKLIRTYTFQKKRFCTGAPLAILGGDLFFSEERESLFARVKFKNMSKGTVVRVAAVILEEGIDGAATVPYVYEGLSIAPGAVFGRKTAIPLPHAEATAFSVKVKEVTLSDGTVLTDCPLAPTPKQEPIAKLLDHNMQVAWRHRYGKRAVYQTTGYGDAWLCTCGTPNLSEETECSECHARHEELVSPDLSALAKEGFLLRLRTHEEKDTIKSLSTALVLLDNAPEGLDTAPHKERIQARLSELFVRQASRRRKTKIAFAISAPALLLVAAILILSFTLFIPMGHYNKGVELCQKGERYEAMLEFQKCYGFSNSAKWISSIKSSVLADTEAAIDNGDLTLAHNIMDPFRYYGYYLFEGSLNYYECTLYGTGSKALPYVIEANSNKSFYVSNTGTYFLFKPKTSGTYKIYTTGTADTEGTLYDSNMSFLKSNSGNYSFNKNFSIERYLSTNSLIADTIYVIKVSNEGAGSAYTTLRIEKK